MIRLIMSNSNKTKRRQSHRRIRKEGKIKKNHKEKKKKKKNMKGLDKGIIVF